LIDFINVLHLIDYVYDINMDNSVK